MGSARYEAWINTQTGRPIEYFYDYINSLREVLTENRTYYVRADGSDSNDGLEDSSSGAFLTLQKAFNVVKTIDSGLYTITIQLGSGSFAGGSYVGPVMGTSVTLQGDTTTPSNCHISSAGITVFQGALSVKGMKTTSAGGAGLLAFGPNSYMAMTGKMEFGAATRQINAQAGGVIVGVTNYEIVAGASFHYSAQNGGKILIDSGTVTVTGTPAFSSAFADARRTSLINLLSGVAFSGSATGKRYNVVTNASIDTSGGGATFLPGDVAGTNDGFGCYT